MSTSNKNNNNNNNKKDGNNTSLAAVLAGELASNLFDKLKKKNTNSTSPNATTASNLNNNSSSSTSSSSLSSDNQNDTTHSSTLTNAINLAISFHKSLNKTNDNSSSSSNNNNNNNNNNNKINDKKQLVIIDDDDEFDDKDFKLDSDTSSSTSFDKKFPPRIPASQSVIEINQQAQQAKEKSLTELKQSVTSAEINRLDVKTSNNVVDSYAKTQQTPNTPTSSTNTLNKFFDEAEQLKKKLFSKTKSSMREVSLDNLKTKVVQTSSLPPSNVTTPVNDDDLIIKENHNSLESSLDLSSIKTKENNLNSSISFEEINNKKIEEIHPQQTIKCNNEITINDTVKIKNDNNTISKSNDNLKIALIVLISILFSFYYIMPKIFTYFFLTYAIGLLNGAFVSIGLFCLMLKMDLLKYVIKNSQFLSSLQSTKMENIDNNTSLEKEEEEHVRHLLIETALHKDNKKNFDGVYKGWMNELREVYDPLNYFLNKTRSVYITLDGTMLRLQTTTQRIPKRAVCDEKIEQITFNEMRIYDLTGCEVFILPKELVRKRYWSKKYPLCIKGAKLLNSKSNQSMSSSNSISSLADKTGNLDAESNRLDEGTLILFGRCDREKEEWFKLFKKSSKKELIDSQQYIKLNRRTSSINIKKSPSLSFSNNSEEDKFLYKMTSSPDQSNEDNNLSNSEENNNLKSISTQTQQGLLYDTSLTFINTFLIRAFADFFNRQDYVKLIQTKIQNKLSKISVPYFMESLVVTDLNLGSVIPKIKETSEPWHDEKGLWVHLKIDYSGGLQMSLATKLNLMKLKSSNNHSSSASSNFSSFSFKKLENNNNGEESLTNLNESFSSSSLNDGSKSNDEQLKKNIFNRKHKKGLAIVNSDEEDSPESSGDEYVHTGFNDEENILIETVNPSKKLLSMVSKIASSNYFQKATENKFIKMAMENVSNVQLLLNVEVKKISGTVALNIPTYPSDRVWYGFVKTPELILAATPQVGEKELTYSGVSEWIAEKLKQEFQKVLVFPNMDDFYIPILNSEAW